MSERFTRLFTLPEALYAEGAPVVIEAGALLKDNQSGKVLAQLKLKSISPKVIKALTVKIAPLDTASHPLGEEVAYQYLDLCAYRDHEFGSKTPVALPDASTRGFSAAVTEVIFGDNSLWQSDGTPWEVLKKPVPLDAAVDDPELRTQIRLEYGDRFTWMPAQDRDLWRCACGRLNHRGEDLCDNCQQSLSQLLAMDMEALKARRDARLAQEAAQAQQARMDAQVKAKKAGKLAAIVVPIAAVVILAALLISGNLKKKAAYEEAMALAHAGQCAEAVDLLEEAGYKDAEDQVYGPLYEEADALLKAGDYEAAKAAFEELGSYSDSSARVEEAEAKIQEEADRAEQARLQGLYEEAEALLARGDTVRGAMAFGAIADYQDARERSFALWREILPVHDTISARGGHTAALKTDGTVAAVGYNQYEQCEVSDWSDVISVSTHMENTFGLKPDGTLIVAGRNKYGQCDVSDWNHIKDLATSWYHTVGLKEDGTVVATGNNDEGQCNVSDWKDVVAVSAGSYHTVALKKDGTVVAVGSNLQGQCDVSDWKDIVAVSAEFRHTVGLKADGTVVAVGEDLHGKCDVSGWTDIVAISAGEMSTIGLKADGTVVAVGLNNHGQCNVSGWEDIVAISAGGLHTVGLKADGTMVATNYIGDYYKGQCDVSDWGNIKLP